jgi:glycosyltransferase involved in cell wall biosynthesis
MKIGLVVQSGVELGGAHNYEANFHDMAQKVAKNLGYELVLFVPDKFKAEAKRPAQLFRYRSSPARFVLAHMRANPITLSIFRLIGLGMTNLERQAVKQGIDVLIFASPNHLSPGVHGIPMVTTAWDFGHLDLPHYPETGLGGLWKWREELYSTTAARSVLMFCDSQSTTQRLVSRYGVDSNRVREIGLLPSVPENVTPEQLDKPHFIYPAMFWAHKDHFLLLESFSDFIKANGEIAYLVLTGKGPLFEKVQSYAKELGISQSVQFLGLVPRARLMSLIAGSRGLLMASILGPSNIPPLEAALLGVPVVASDVHKMTDMLSGLKVVPSSNRKAWATAISDLWSNKVAAPKVIPLGEEATLTEAFEFLALQIRGTSR